MWWSRLQNQGRSVQPTARLSRSWPHSLGPHGGGSLRTPLLCCGARSFGPASPGCLAACSPAKPAQRVPWPCSPAWPCRQAAVPAALPMGSRCCLGFAEALAVPVVPSAPPAAWLAPTGRGGSGRNCCHPSQPQCLPRRDLKHPSSLIFVTTFGGFFGVWFFP